LQSDEISSINESSSSISAADGHNNTFGQKSEHPKTSSMICGHIVDILSNSVRRFD